MDTLFSYTVFILHALAALFGLPAEPAVSEPAEDPANAVQASVLYVVDGDTIGVSIEGKEERVRYIGIDAPEAGYEEELPECYAEEATAANYALVAGADVRLLAGSDDRDNYGRLLRYVYISDTFVNETLVRQGAATALQVPPNTEHAEVLRRAESVAKEEGRGLWTSCDR